MSQITLQQTGYGIFYGFPWGGSFAYCIGTQEQYDDLGDFQTVSIQDGYTTGSDVHNALIATPPTEPVTVYILDMSVDVSMIQNMYNGQPLTIDRSYLPSDICFTTYYPRCYNLLGHIGGCN